MLSKEEQERYDRQIIMRGIGEEGQEKLKRAKIVIAGSGGLGSPVATYLAAAGVGTLRIIDHDKVELSNLNRQILHWDKDIGTDKVVSAREKLTSLNNNVQIEAINDTIDESNVLSLVKGFDVIIDAMDNLETRFLLNSTAIELNIPFIHGAIYGFEGRATTIIPGKTACLRCIYQGIAPKEKFPVIGVVPGIIGCIEASEALKYLLHIGTLLSNRLLMFNGLSMKFTELPIKRNPSCEHCGHLQGE